MLQLYDFYVWQNIVKSSHNKLFTTDLFLFRASREKVSANELEEEEGLGGCLLELQEAEPLEEEIEGKGWSVNVSAMETAFTLRRKRLDT